MVDPFIEELVAEFIVTFKNSHINYSLNPLDFSHESLARVDTFLRSIETFAPLKNQENILKSASAYIGLACYEIQKKLYKGQLIKISLRTIPSFEIILELSSKERNQTNLDFQVPIFTSIKRISEVRTGTIKLFDNFETAINSGTRKYLNFCTGIICGLSQFGTGQWRDRKIDDLAAELNTITSTIAVEYSRKNSLRFPSSTILSDQNFYKYNLILPPLGYQEAFPGIRSISVIAPTLKNDLTPNELHRVVLALLSSPDEIQSSIGFVLSTTLQDKALHNLAANFASSFWPNSKNFRPAVLLAREIMSQETHWLKTLGKGQKEASLALLRLDQGLGLCPYLVAPVESTMLNQENLMYIEMLSLSQVNEAWALGALIKERKDLPNWLSYQLLFLDAYQSNFSDLNKILQELEILTQQGYFSAWDLKTRVSLILGEIESAFNSLKSYFKSSKNGEVLAQDKNLLNLFLGSLLKSKIDAQKKTYWLGEIKDLIMENDKILSSESFFLINLQLNNSENSLILDQLSSITQTGIQNSSWEKYYNFNPINPTHRLHL